MNRILTVFILLIATHSLFARAELTSSSPDNARVYIIEPQDGQVMDTAEFKVKFGLAGMGVAPAGADINNTGHHHLLIDLDDGQLPDEDQPLPANDNILHFGGGQTETTITLSPGQHTLQLLLGNYLHIPHNPPVYSERITITVP